jgi:formylglycine-generating enzyme required for sulfatase activity
MGEVYLAYDSDLERDVAVKVLSGEDAVPDRVRRFIQEAKAASALNHPNVATVFEIGSHDNYHFIAMEVVPGLRLRDRLLKGPVSTDEAIAIATQIAAALAAAHDAGVVHRDIKPENVIVRPDGYAKVLDFGLAKLREVRGQDEALTMVKTRAGVAVGTVGYMAPEQLSGGEVGPPADVFSLGVVLYEMLAGERPFAGATPTEIATAILTKTPRPLDVPPKVGAILESALGKEPAARYASAKPMYDDLRKAGREAAPPEVRSKRRFAAALAALLAALVVAWSWSVVRSRRARSAAESIVTAERFLSEQRYPEAYDAAIAGLAAMPSEQRLRDVVTRSTTSISFESQPPGAAVFLERYQKFAGRTRAGVTPLTIEHLPLADYVVTMEKPGFRSARRPLPARPVMVGGEATPMRVRKVAAKLFETERIPADMVAVEGGRYGLAGSWRASDRAVELNDFLIDRCEVSNADFYAFIRDGGYRRSELWKTISFDVVQTRFRDATGLPGPRGWSGGAPPPGRENHPVTDLTWHEASAYALWKGKQLPSIYQWEKAARFPLTSGVASSFPWGLIGEGVDSTERMNFNGKGTMPVDTMPFGIGPSGAHHLAGNVAEWTRNPMPPGYAIRGGSWNDALYTFNRTGAVPAMYTSSELGFRCVKPLVGDGTKQGEFALASTGFVPKYRPVDDKTFQGYLARYEYGRAPLKARVAETVDQGDWTRERIEYDVDGRTVPAYLYLPKNYRRPLQVVHFSPAGDVYSGWRSVPQSVEITLAPIIRSGRAVFSVVMPGFIGRPHPPGFTEPDSRSAEAVDYTVRQMTELRRGIDYLETRKDLDPARIAFFAISAGSWQGVILVAVENRYRSVLFVGTGLDPREVSDIPAANRINFAPHIAAPKLMIQGRYDESNPLTSEAEPLYRLMPEPKRLQIFDGGHVPVRKIGLPMFIKWFDESMGRVE